MINKISHRKTFLYLRRILLIKVKRRSKLWLYEIIIYIRCISY